MKKGVNLFLIIGIILGVIVLGVTALLLTRCSGGEDLPTEPSTTEATLPAEQTEVPTETEHVHAYAESVTAADCISGGYTVFTCACGESYVGNETEALGHSWVDATCTEPKKCSVCNVTEGRANDHSWDEGKVTVPAQEDKEGEKLFTCKVCQETKKQIIPTKDHVHNHEETVVTVEPTCTEEGYTTHTCRCGDTVKDTPVAALGHKWQDATCTTPKVCTVCGATEGDALGHDWADATCTEPKTCKRCSATIGGPKGHAEKTVTGKAATCTETGLTDGKQCSVCKTWIVEQKTIAAKGHSEKKVTGKAATCTATGLTDGKQCSVCQTWLEKQETIPALGHKETDVKGKAATCTATGLTDGVQCSVCKDWIKKQETIPALGHKEDTLAAKEPTCTETGLTAGKKCSVCQTTTVKQEVVPAKGHTEETLAAKAPTCTATGLTAGKKCTVCKVTTVKQETVAALGHNFGSWTTTKQATCGADGSQKRTCTRCTHYETKTIAATGNHTYQWGLCSVCGHDTLLKQHTFTHESFNVDNTIGGSKGSYWTLSDVFDMTSIKNRDMTMYVTVSFTLKDVDAGGDGKYIYGYRMYNGTSDTATKLYDAGTSEIGTGTVNKNLGTVITIKASSLSNNNLGFLFVEDTWSLFGVKTNEYQVSNFKMTVTFQ